MVSLSPRSRDSLEFGEPEALDRRLSSFGSLSLESSGYDEFEFEQDEVLFASTPDLSRERRKSRLRRSTVEVQSARPFRYPSVANGGLFRLIVLYPGSGTELVRCRLMLSNIKRHRSDHQCLSYCWGTTERDQSILIRLTQHGEYFKFAVTKNLHSALRCLRKPTSNLLLWVDQICINQQHDLERAYQVQIMKDIFYRAREVVIWLGEEDGRSSQLCEYARKMKRGDDRRSSELSRILSRRELQFAMQELLMRPWFTRVWVVPECALARHCTVQCGRSQISWDNLVRLIRDTRGSEASGFDKQTCLLGNARQRIAILTEMARSQKENKAQTDITELLILAKASAATDVRDKVYAFYGLTHVTTFPDYQRSPEHLYVEIASIYVNAILYESAYSSWHGLTEGMRTFQVMSILYSAGILHQHQQLKLPSWVPDWTFAWHLAPMWCKTTPNVNSASPKRGKKPSLRGDFRAGGDERGEFEVLNGPNGSKCLGLSAVILDSLVSVGDKSPPSTPGKERDGTTSPLSMGDSQTLRYGRVYFETSKGHTGIATPGIQPGDLIAIVLGGDVPVVLRSFACGGCHRARLGEVAMYQLLCECMVQTPAVMDGDVLWNSFGDVRDIVLI